MWQSAGDARRKTSGKLRTFIKLCHHFAEILAKRLVHSVLIDNRIDPAEILTTNKGGATGRFGNPNGIRALSKGPK